MTGNPMKHSLRFRLSFLLLITLCLTVIPILYLTWSNVGSTVLQMEQRAFSSLMTVEEGNLSSSYQNLLSNKVSSVIMRKHQLMATAQQTKNMLHLLAENGAFSSKSDTSKSDTLIQSELLQKITAELADTNKLTRIVTMAASRADLLRFFSSIDSKIQDAKGRSVAAILHKLGPRGDFAVLQLPSHALLPSAHSFPVLEPVLLYFLPLEKNVPSNSFSKESGPYFVITMSFLSDLEYASHSAEQAVIKSMQKKFESMGYYPHQVLALFDGDGAVLARHGNPGMEEMKPHLEKAREEGMVEAYIPSPDGEMVYQVAYIRAFDWFLVIGAPTEEIRAPSSDLLHPLLGIGLLGLLLTGLLSLSILAYSLKPLNMLTRKTHELPNLNFSSPDVAAQIGRNLPLDRQDELGQLARSFEQMGSALARNIQNLMSMTMHKERMEGELRMARDIQIGILPAPESAPDNAQLRVSAFLCPAKEVGGDLYDFFRLPDGRYAFVLGDVSDKGVPAALFMAMTVTLARYSLGNGLGAAKAMTGISEVLSKNNASSMFVTLFIGLYDRESGTLEYANGGHCPPFVFSAQHSEVRAMKGLSGPMLGVFPGVEYTDFTDKLEPGEYCLLFTDGVTESMNGAQELFGYDRLKEFLSGNEKGPRSLLDDLYTRFLDYRGDAPQSDDITMLVFGRP